MEKIIEGYNKEKEILVNALVKLNGDNKYITIISSVKNRLQEIDKNLQSIARARIEVKDNLFGDLSNNTQ